MKLLMHPLLLFYFNLAVTFCDLNPKSFNEDFLFGVATSSYQIEGAWNENGKGLNIWDQFTHDHPEKIKDRSTGDISCNSYHKIKEDVALLKELGVQFYRFSMSWSRLLPSGYSNYTNPDGIRYYNELIDELVKNGIKPMVTLFHWDLPVNLQNLGGWTNPMLVDIFADYAEIAFEYFGDRVPYWITFNIGTFGYGDDSFAPLINQPGIADYLYSHISLKAHVKVYHNYNKRFRTKQKGKIGIVTFDGQWFKSNTSKVEDLQATERAREFAMGWFNTPLLRDGDYPLIMKDRIGYRSKMEGFMRSRLPTFSETERILIKGAYDFIALNLYTTNLVANAPEAPFTTTSNLGDMKISLSQDPDIPSSAADWLKVAPNTVRSVLQWMKVNYGNTVPIIITENGYADTGEIEDYKRINFHQLYLSSLLDAIYYDDINVLGYTAWSLMDNFEWNAGYTQKFGFYQVDFNDPERKRKAKLSAKFFKDVISNRNLQNTTN